MANPKLTIKKEPVDWLLEGLAVLGLLISLVLPLIYYPDLPDEIPIHFNGKGEVDGYGGKAMIWIFPGIGLLMFLLLFIINRFPHTFNFPVTITEENAPIQYRIATRMNRSLNALITLIFAYFCWSTIQVANGHMAGLGWTAILLVVLILGVIAYFLKQAYANK